MKKVNIWVVAAVLGGFTAFTGVCHASGSTTWTETASIWWWGPLMHLGEEAAVEQAENQCTSMGGVPGPHTVSWSWLALVTATVECTRTTDMDTTPIDTAPPMDTDPGSMTMPPMDTDPGSVTMPPTDTDPGSMTMP